jgi:signal transduction histidine kinase
MYCFIRIFINNQTSTISTFAPVIVGMKQAFRNWIIGENNFIESWNEYRQIMLSAQYSVISLAILAIGMYNVSPAKHPQAFLALDISFILILFGLLLHRIGRHCTSNIIVFSTLNTLLFLIGTSESLTTGAFLLLIPFALATCSVFSYKQRKLAMLLVGSSIMLFVLALSCQYTILPFRQYSESQIQSYQLLNFGICFAASIMAIYLLIEISHHNARNLKKANDQLTSLNKELDRFAYATSHDLRAPLLSVKGLIELIKSAKPEDQKKYFQLIDKRIDSLDTFIMDITNYSRNNRLEIFKESVNVADLVNDIWESLRFSPEANGIHFINEVPQTVMVINDARRMKVVFTNLIANAIRYHDRRKEQRYVKVYYKANDNSFSLHVEDNGLGIAPELHERIFDMFFRGNEKSQGTGLGLYIVRETLNKLSGKVLLQSAPLQGSTFSITLPK